MNAAVVANPPPGSLQGLPALRLIQSLWAGVDRLLADRSLPAGVPIARMVDPAMNAAMAETALWATLALQRDFFRYARQQRQGRWQQHAQRRADETPVLVHWTLAEDVRALRRVREAVDAGRPLSLALSQARVWGQKEKLFERAVPLLADHHLARWLAAASVCDGLVKGLRHPDWPNDPWDALQRLVLMMLEPLRPLAPAARAGAPVLALQAGQ